MPPSPTPPPIPKGQNVTLLIFFQINRKKNIFHIFFLFSNFFFRFFLTFFDFFWVFGITFTATLLEIAQKVCYKKGRKCKKSVHMFQRFSIFEAVWHSRNLKRVYIFSTKAVLRPPCWRYRGGSFTKKIENPKIASTCFFVLPYFEPIGSHATSNFYIYI